MEGVRPLRFGLLGCSAVAEYAMIAPAKAEAAISIVAVGSRDAERATDYAVRHGIAHAHGSYEAVLSDPDVDAIYIGLPNSLHHNWVLAALDAGKPVLCEKPVASNRAQARAMSDRADALGLTFMEAFHWRYHPFVARLEQIIEAGELGEIRSIACDFHIPAVYVDPDNIRLARDLAGGAMMDQGCYCINLLRYFARCEPEVIDAKATLTKSGVDGAMQARVRFSNGIMGAMHCSMNGAGGAIFCSATITGSEDSVAVEMPFLPHMGATLRWRGGVERPTSTPSYTYQARFFAQAVRDGLTGLGHDGVANMAVIDDVYRAAGMIPHG